MTQLEYAKNNTLTPLMKKIARQEALSPGQILQGILKGEIVIPANIKRRQAITKPCGIGSGLRTKVNVNIGTSPEKHRIKDELKKLKIASDYGADTVMDLSTGGDLARIRKDILRHSPLPVGTVPIYEIAVNAQKNKGDFLKFNKDDILRGLELQAEEGVDFFTIHSGVTKKSISGLNRNTRILSIVSRGGAIIANWMRRHKEENPFYAYFDRILDIAYKYDVTISLGDGLRPGSILDATDKAQVSELEVLGELGLRAKKKNVQVMIEGPGHIPLDQIKKNILLEKKICRKAPFYVLGPLVTDVACGYDHINGSIGGALAASLGADFLCFVTPSEHLRHPSLEDTKEGLIASRIAAHAADIAKKVKTAIQWDREMSAARRERDWKKQIRLSVDPAKAKKYRLSSQPQNSADICTMCGKYCSIKLMERCI